MLGQITARVLLFGVTAGLALWSLTAYLMGKPYNWRTSPAFREFATYSPIFPLVLGFLVVMTARDAFPEISLWLIVGLILVGVCLGHVFW